MSSILPNPVRLVQGRYQTLVFNFTDSEGAPIDISMWDFICDFRYAIGDTDPVLSLDSRISPPSIVKDGIIVGQAYLVFAENTLDPVVIPTTQNLDFPFCQLVAELIYLEDAVRKPGFMFRAHVYQATTRSA